MDIAELQRHFAAYGSGELPEVALRNSIRTALNEDPYLSSAFIALAEAYHRANVIDADLQATIVADIAEVTAPKLALTMLRPPRPRGAGAGSFAANNPAYTGNTDLPQTLMPNAAAPDGRPGESASDELPSGPRARSTSTTGSFPASSTGSTKGSAWDSAERLAEVAAPLYPGSVLRERFELVAELGRGGMGVVYKAFDRRRAELREHHHVAIKVLNDEFKRHPLAVRALQREARKAQKLAHPNIVTVHDFDRDAGNVYMVMELLSGRSLDQVIRSDAKSGMPVPRVLEIVKALGAALSYAHEQDIVHSDFKPSNAFITDEGKIKVLDFGIARAAPSRLELSEKTLFDAGQLGAISPAYASLEMMRGEEPDVRDDIYALACVTYELLTGSHPFKRIDALKAHESGLQPPVIRALSRSQWRALRQALAFERAARTASVDAFVTQLLDRRSRAKRRVGVTSIAVIGIAAAGTLLWQWDIPRVAALQRDLQDPESARFSMGLAELRAAPYFLQAQILADGDVRGALISHYGQAIRQAVALPKLDYGRARILLTELQTLLPISRPVIQLGRQLDADSRTELARQIQDRDRALLGSVLVGSQGSPNVTSALEHIRNIDPESAALRDSVVTLAYEKGANEALGSGNTDLARELITAGLAAAPNDPGLRAARGRLASQSAPAEPPPVQPSEDVQRELREVLATPEASAQWAAKVQELLRRLAEVAPANSAEIDGANQLAAQTFVAAASAARGDKHYDEAGKLLDVARSFNAQASEVAAESVALERDRAARSTPTGSDAQGSKIETLKKQLETQAAEGDVVAASTTASTLRRLAAEPGYLARRVPEALISSYVHRAKSQFASGQVDAALETLAEGRRKFGRSAELKDLETRYVPAGDIYDRLSSAVVLSLSDQRQSLEALRSTEGDEYPVAERMLAQTLANRIADHRAANRAPVADKLLEAGRQLFPNYASLLEQGTAGALSGTHASVSGQQDNPAPPQ